MADWLSPHIHRISRVTDDYQHRPTSDIVAEPFGASHDPARRCRQPPGDLRGQSAGSGGRAVQPFSGEIRLASFDKVTKGQGHHGLAIAIGIANNSEWRGFLIGRMEPCFRRVTSTWLTEVCP